MSKLAKGSPVVRLDQVTLTNKRRVVLNNISLEVTAGQLVGLIGPDGVGKSTLMSLITGVLIPDYGQVETLGGDMLDQRHRNKICAKIAYMPQGLGKNLYHSLSIEENLQFFGRLFGRGKAALQQRIEVLTKATRLYPFLHRPVGKLSGGMKQKLGLCCSLIHYPELLILDEPTTGVDPLSRVQFWELIEQVRRALPQLSILVSTAYMDEAEHFERLIAMDAGKILAVGTPQELKQLTAADSLEIAFTRLLAAKHQLDHQEIFIPPLVESQAQGFAIEAKQLTKKFGDFTAVNQVSFQIRRGEIFGFLGSNGCGKSTTMKMLTGLIPPTEGSAWLFGHPVDANDVTTRRRVGYMSQNFSLYSELSVRQNLELHARLFQIPEAQIASLVTASVNRFGLEGKLEALPGSLPLGMRQRLSLAVATIHQPEMLILDEPTSGVDPVARDSFWRLIIELSRKDQVTIFVSTHFMSEAMRCDRISLMHAGTVLVSDRPDCIIAERQVNTLEQAFISYLKEAEQSLTDQTEAKVDLGEAFTLKTEVINPTIGSRHFSLTRLLSYASRETKELAHDPVRGTLALFGSLLLMLIMGFGISLDVENLSFAVLDRDQTALSRDYILNLAGSRYFTEHRPLRDYQELDTRMRQGEIALALEFPAGFAQALKQGRPVELGAWIDGAMPQRAETVRSYVQAMHYHWLANLVKQRLGQDLSLSSATVETRFRYNPEVRSLPAMVPAVIPLMLLMIPAMMAALAVVREKELGSIMNFYVNPTTRTEFLLGKQFPYVVMGMVNFFFMLLAATIVFGVSVKGSLLALTLATLVFVCFSTGFGLLASTFTRSQTAAIFLTAVGTMIPAVQYSGLLNPISSLQGVGRIIGSVYPATHFFTISRGIFNKALDLSSLSTSFVAMLCAVPVVLILAISLLKKREN